MKVKNYLLVEQIGAGSFSTVFKACDVNDQNKIFAIKSMRDIPQNEKKAIMREIQILKDIQQKNIRNVVNYVADFEEKNKWYIVFEFCGKGDLENFLKKQGRLPESFCKNVASSVIEPLTQLHQKGIAHRDLKLSNILINDEYNFKIADFGMAKAQTTGIMESYCGTPYAMAPQVLKRQSYDTKCDTWSLGIMIYQLVYGRLPFDGRKNGGGIFGLTSSVLNDQPYFSNSVKVSQQCIDFIKKCLRKDPAQRPTMKQLAHHQWLSIGVNSAISRGFLKQSFEGGSDSIEQQTKRRTKQILNQAVQDHLLQLFKHYKLISKQIAGYLNTFDKYYQTRKNMKQTVILMIAKIMKELVGKKVVIDIDKQMTFTIKLSKIDTFKNHIRNIQGILNQALKNLGVEVNADSNKNLQRQLISFVIDEGETCLSFEENYPDKIKLIQYLSKLPINIPNNSNISIAWAFNETGARLQLKFNEYIKQLAEQQVYKFINEPCNREEGQKNWIIEHHFQKMKREGTQIQMGEFISRVIDINSPSD